MTKTFKDKFFLVQADILPDSILKAVIAKDLLLKGEAATVIEAVAKVHLSRSAFYKYKDKVFPLQPGFTGNNITINLTLEHRTGILSRVLATIADLGGNIITINQEMPSHGKAKVGIYLDISNTTGDMDQLLKNLKEIPGVITVSIN